MTSNRPAVIPAEMTGSAGPAPQPAHRRSGPEPVSLFDPGARRLARAATDLDTDLMVRIVLASIARRPPRPSPPSVLLACADEELQVFPLEVLVGALEEAGASCCVLGARVPPYALVRAATRLRPTAVIIWSQTRETADPAQIAVLLEAHPATTVLAAGPGWNSSALPPQVVRPTDLSTALVLALAVLEGHTAQPKSRSSQ